MGKRLIDRINPLHKGEALPEALSGPLAPELIVREASSLDQLRSTTHFSLAGFHNSGDGNAHQDKAKNYFPRAHQLIRLCLLV